MEIIEDGNLVDRVRILLQRDMQYYQESQTVLREPLCLRVSGGKLDFPRHASFAAIKIVTWWETEFVAAFKHSSGLSVANRKDSSAAVCEGVVKKSQPSEFIVLIVDTSEQLLEHLHTLIQEALDHADLAVLTATLGAAALIRNCLWCYNQQIKGEVPVQSSNKVYKCYKSYHEMAEALAERLLDLHCRLISLYILNEADSLSWQCEKPFFEKERSSFVIQMWWLYMQGTRADLWTTVPPKMAQRVFAGMLNESLSIITARFIHGRPDLARSEQFWADAFNVLCCTAHLALGACAEGDEIIGLHTRKLSTTTRDIHAKCGELLVCLLLRGAPLKVLFQTFRKGLQNLRILEKQRGPAPWVIMCAPHLLHWSSEFGMDSITLAGDQAIALELNLLKLQPQPNWQQLMKILSMRNYAVARMLFEMLSRQCIGCVEEISSAKMNDANDSDESCGGFLCTGYACYKSLDISPALGLYSLTHTLIHTDMDPLLVIVPGLGQDKGWTNYLDRRQVWNQARPPWLNALLTPLRPMMLPIVDTLLEAVKTGASIYQAMSLALSCLTELYVCVPMGVLRTAFLMNENIPAHCRPIGGSVLLHILCASLYSVLLEVSSSATTDTVGGNSTCSAETVDESGGGKFASALTLAEALCSIDEDDKHTAQIDSLLGLIRENVESREANRRKAEPEDLPCTSEAYADELLFSGIGRRSLKVVHEYLVRTSDSMLDRLKVPKGESSTIEVSLNDPTKPKPLLYTMFHIEDTAFDQLLIDHTKANWQMILDRPLSITMDRVRSQLLLRPEFKNPELLSSEEREAASCIKEMCAAARRRP